MIEKELLDRAEAGDSEAQFEIGCRYYNGEGMETDKNSAYIWFKKAARKGNENAQYYLGVCYYNGEGTSEDLIKAKSWLEKSARKGNRDARTMLNREDVKRKINQEQAQKAILNAIPQIESQKAVVTIHNSIGKKMKGYAVRGMILGFVATVFIATGVGFIVPDMVSESVNDEDSIMLISALIDFAIIIFGIVASIFMYVVGRALSEIIQYLEAIYKNQK